MSLRRADARFLTLLAAGLALAPLAAAQDWPMLHGNAAHTGSHGLSGGADGAVLWKFLAADAIEASPAVADGNVFVGDRAGRLYAVNASGFPVWNRSLGTSISSSAAVVGGVVYVGSAQAGGAGRLHALRAADGADVWPPFSTPRIVHASPAVAEGRVYFAHEGGEVVALDAATGTRVWNRTLGGDVYSSPTVAEGLLYVGAYDHAVYALNASTGAVAWQRSTGGLVDSTPAVSGGVVYVGSWDHRLYAWDAQTGAPRWNVSTGGAIVSDPSVAGGVVYVGSGSTKLHAYRASDGVERWSFETGGLVATSAAVSGDTVYFGSVDDWVYALNATDGRLRWSRQTGGDVWSSPAVVDGTVYVGSYDRSLYALDAGQGQAPTPPSAAFFVTNLSVAPAVPRFPEAVVASVRVANQGAADGTAVVRLRVNGEPLDERNVTLGPGGSQLLSFAPWNPPAAGQYRFEAAFDEEGQRFEQWVTVHPPSDDGGDDGDPGSDDGSDDGSGDGTGNDSTGDGAGGGQGQDRDGNGNTEGDDGSSGTRGRFRPHDLPPETVGLLVAVVPVALVGAAAVAIRAWRR
ncbi:MAG TPA: PQQ-binding-like beta-propeller repeat protein [Candidatus Thermoplasmatota archaeon]|nr:PQQ-binding-like beta-propeller repeat protein [Candidatus Thermoplasmatota archaeon]